MVANNLDNWANAASIYAELKGENRYSLFCKSFVDDHFADAQGLKILDAGCGDGEYTEMFREKGAKATGCDGSASVIAIAKRKYPLCQFDVADLSAALPYQDRSFDMVFSNLVLMDIDPLDMTIHECSRILKPRGTLFLSIIHPAFYLGDWGRDENGVITHKQITSYLSPQTAGMEWGTQPVLHYHRPLSFYFNLLAQNGLSLSRMYEPQVFEETKIPDIPLYLFAEFVKQPASL